MMPSTLDRRHTDHLSLHWPRLLPVVVRCFPGCPQAVSCLVSRLVALGRSLWRHNGNLLVARVWLQTAYLRLGFGRVWGYLSLV